MVVYLTYVTLFSKSKQYKWVNEKKHFIIKMFYYEMFTIKQFAGICIYSVLMSSL